MRVSEVLQHAHDFGRVQPRIAHWIAGYECEVNLRHVCVELARVDCDRGGVTEIVYGGIEFDIIPKRKG
jgi:hypothetical protein